MEGTLANQATLCETVQRAIIGLFQGREKQYKTYGEAEDFFFYFSQHREAAAYNLCEISYYNLRGSSRLSKTNLTGEQACSL